LFTVVQAEGQSPRYLLDKYEALLEVHVGLRPNLQALFEIEFVGTVGTGIDKCANFAGAKAEVAVDTTTEILFHRCVSRIAIHAYQGLGEALDQGEDRSASAFALRIEGVCVVQPRGLPQNSYGEIAQMIVMAFKLAQNDAAFGLPGNVDLFSAARRATPRKRGHSPRLVQVHALCFEVPFQYLRQCTPPAIAMPGQWVMANFIVVH
jgi:hypothetical protein